MHFIVWLNSLSLIITLTTNSASFASSSEQLAAERRQKLVVLNWSDYIDPTVVSAFEQQFNAQVREVFYESDDDRDSMLAETDGHGYDLVLVNSANSTDPSQLDAAEELLLHQKPYVRAYSYPSVDEKSDLATGKAWVTMIYNGDALAVKEHHEHIVYTLPEEGGGVWVDYLTVLQSSTHKALAMDFINFLNEPENAAQIARFVYFATPNQAAEKLLPAEFLNDPVIYPNADALKKSEFLTDLPPRVAKRHNGIFAQLLQP